MRRRGLPIVGTTRHSCELHDPEYDEFFFTCLDGDEVREWKHSASPHDELPSFCPYCGMRLGVERRDG